MKNTGTLKKIIITAEAILDLIGTTASYHHNPRQTIMTTLLMKAMIYLIKTRTRKETS